MMVLLGLPLGILSARYRDTLASTIWPPDRAARRLHPGLRLGGDPHAVFAFSAAVPARRAHLRHLHRRAAATGFLPIDTLLAGNWAAFGDAAWHIVLPALRAGAVGHRPGGAAHPRQHGRDLRPAVYRDGAVLWLSAASIANRYAFRPALIPSLTIIGLDFAAMLGNAFLVEAVFVWPGLSRYGVEVIISKDLNAIVGTVLIIAALS